MLPSRAVAFVLFVLMSVLVSARAETPAVTPALKAPIQGTLPNGLRYFILPHTAEPGRVSLRLVVHAGSLDEHDDELGYAHLVEHMAFRGTKKYAAGKLIPFFQKIGITWGADVNADTSFSFTDYKLDLSAQHAGKLPEALQVLRDFADGQQFSPKELLTEKKVVLNELRTRNTNEYQTRVKRVAFYFEGTLLPNRLPAGDPALIEKATAEKLRAFYRRCYQPERMTLIVVGDVSPDKIVPLLTAAFSSLQGFGPPTVPITPGQPPAGKIRSGIMVSSAATSSIMSFVSVAQRTADTVVGHATDYRANVAFRLLDRRLKERQAQNPERFGRAGVFQNLSDDGYFMIRGVEAHASVKDWAASIALLDDEKRRAETGGFTADEINEATSSLLAALQTERETIAGESTRRLANRVMGALARHRTWIDPSASLAEAKAAMATFTSADAVAALRDVFQEDSLCLVLTTPIESKDGPEKLIDVYRESVARPMQTEAKSQTAALQFFYTHFGPEGTVATHQTEAGLGLQMIRFDNGVKFNLRPSPVEPRQFHLTARMGRDFADQPRDKPSLAMLANCLLGASDLGHHTREELSRLIHLHGLNAGVTFAGNQFCISIEGPSTEMAFAFQFITAFLSDLKLEPSRLKPALSSYLSITEPVMRSPDHHMQADFFTQMTSNDPRTWIISPADVAQYTFDDMTSWVRQHWLQGPLEIGLAGDFNPDTAIQIAAGTIGTLSPRKEPAANPGERLALPIKAYRNITKWEGGGEKVAVLYFGWPAADLTAPDACNALQFSVDVLVDRLRKKFREELGATYSPIGSVERLPLQRGYGYAWVKLTFDPKQQPQKLAERVIKMADELARQGITTEEFIRLGEPLRTRARENLLSNAWWLNSVLAYAQTEPAVLADARALPDAFQKLRREDINHAAAVHFQAVKSFVVGTSPSL